MKITSYQNIVAHCLIVYVSYINGGSECPGAKKSKDTEGMFWKRCDPDADTQPIESSS